MKLLAKQQLFSRLISELILDTIALGYDVTCAEFYRTPEQAALNAKKKTGIKNSLHTLRLAADLNLFKNGIYLTNTEDYREIGERWEAMSGTSYECCWGGRFGDGNHFSVKHNGIK